MLNCKKNSGFTLVEMLVVIGILLIVLVALVAIFVSALQIQRYVLSAYQLLDQSSYVMEYMSRSLRMAKKDLTGSCIDLNNSYGYYSGTSGIKLKNEAGDCIGFFLEAGQLKQYKKSGGNETTSALTSSSMEVTAFNVALVPNSGPPAQLQPKATIYLEIKAKGSGPQPKIKLQTTVSARDLDIAP